MRLGGGGGRWEEGGGADSFSDPVIDYSYPRKIPFKGTTLYLGQKSDVEGMLLEFSDIFPFTLNYQKVWGYCGAGRYEI